MKRHTHLHKSRVYKMAAKGFKATEIARFTGCPYRDVKELLYGSISRERRNKRDKRVREVVENS